MYIQHVSYDKCCIHYRPTSTDSVGKPYKLATEKYWFYRSGYCTFSINFFVTLSLHNRMRGSNSVFGLSNFSWCVEDFFIPSVDNLRPACKLFLLFLCVFQAILSVVWDVTDNTCLKYILLLDVCSRKYYSLLMAYTGHTNFVLGATHCRLSLQVT